MKPGRNGMHGSVAVIGLVYLLALAFAPTPGVSAQSATPSAYVTPGNAPGGLSRAIATGNACPHARSERQAAGMRKSARTDYGRSGPGRWKGTSPAAGARHLTVF